MLTRRILGLMLAAGIALAGCGGAPETQTPNPTSRPAATPTVGVTATPAGTAQPSASTTTPTTAPSSVPSASASSAASTTVAIAHSDLGDILVDSTGLTLYAFVPDGQSDPTCYGSCAGNWPAELVQGPVTVGDGLSADLFATVDRTDGGKQLTANKWPLYRLYGSAPSDTSGQGTKNNWYVVSPTGELIK